MLCACGCGEELSLTGRKHKRFIHGHNILIIPNVPAGTELWTENELTYIKDHPELTANELSTAINRTWAAIKTIRNKYKWYATHYLTTPDFTGYFDSLTEEKCYLLGYMAADGNLYKDKDSNWNVSITSKDYDIIQKLCGVVGYSSPKKHGTKYWIMRIRNKSLFQEFERMGITERKTHNLANPILEDNELSWWIRGYFDADGSIYKTNQNQWGCSFCGATEGVINMIATRLNMNFYKHYSQDNFWTCKVGGRNKVYETMKNIYDGANIYMDRKYNLYKQLENEVICNARN